MKKAANATVRFVEDLKRQWMATVDAIIDPLMIVDSKFTVIKANRALAQMAGADIKDVVGKRCYEVFAKRSSPCEGCSMLAAWKAKEAKQFTLENAQPDRFHEVTSQPIFNADGELEGMLQVYRDRTEAKRLQNQLLQSEKMASIGLLAGGIAHELNNPLGGILIFSQMLLREMDKASPHYQDVAEIEAAAQRCKAIVENLLDFARKQPTSGKYAVKETVDVKAAVLSALRFSQVGRPGHDITIDEVWSSEVFTVEGHRNKVIQLFLNLIQNAFQAMPNGGTLTLRSLKTTRKDRTYAAFEVVDTGIGIAPDNLKKIFDPFFTTKGPGEGTGLGLAICHGLAEDLGGGIEVESQLNAGATFRVLLPYQTAKRKSA